MLAPLNKQLEEVGAAYENMQPTARTILRSLKFPTTINALEKEMAETT